MKAIRREDGQSIIMVIFVLVVLIALVALVVDIGNAYAQRRIVQNAADAGALAATRELARGFSNTTNRLVLDKAKDYAELNGIDRDSVVAEYVHFDPDTGESVVLSTVPNEATRPLEEIGGLSVDGVSVDLGKQFNTYLARVIGRDVLSASAESIGQVSSGVCVAGEGEGLFPIAVDVHLFDHNGGKPVLDTDHLYTVWGDKTAPGSFHWLSWNQDPGHASEWTLEANMHDTSRSGVWSDGDYIPCGPGVKNSHGVNAELDLRINGGLPNPVWLPIYDQVDGQGEGTTYRAIGFGLFEIDRYDLTGSDRFIEGYFKRGNLASSEGGCLDFGTTTVKLRPPIDLTRNIAGRVAYEYLSIQEPPSGQTTYPVDVVLVIDKSGSMDYTWGSPPVTKMATARSVMADFVAMLRPEPEVGDQVGLVAFPKSGSDTFDSSYCPDCWESLYHGCDYNVHTSKPQPTYIKLRGWVYKTLTSDVSSVISTIDSLGANGGTPVAHAIKKAIETVTGPEHIDGHAQIIIVASDGIPNGTLNERWTGFSGSETTGMGECNSQAEFDAINQANEAKSAGITVFTIAVGTDFSSELLTAMASPDSDPSEPHFLTAANPTAMQDIYDSLGNRIVTYDGGCTVVPQDAAASGARVTLYKDGAEVTHTFADDGGSFAFTNVDPGTYTFSASTTRDGVTYDVFTNQVGGTELEGDPTLVVEQAEGTYLIHLALKTSNPPECAGGL